VRNDDTALALFVRGIVVVTFCCVSFAAGGGLVAAWLNWLAPRYYPGVYPYNMELYAGAYAIAPAVGQGLLIGLVVGVVVAGGLAWRRQLYLAPTLRAFRMVAAFGLVFAAAGLGIGYCVGTIYPSYYQRAFNADQRHSDFSPIDVGIGLGCSEGLMVGLILGAAVVVIRAWLQTRRVRQAPPAFDQHPYDRPVPPDLW
jgi:hypothetical protein